MRTLIIEADGASRGNPGAASYGAVVREEATGEPLAELAEAIGTATNNVAEYRGLIAGLEAAAALDPAAHVEVRMDSKLVVEQMSGRWQVKHPDLKPLAARARAALPTQNVAYTWVPRSRNKHADKLANQALDAAARGEVWQSPTPLAPATAAKVAWSPDVGRPTRLLLLRHGVTPLTVEKRFAGIGDPELTAQGQDQAQRAARRFKTDVRFGPVDAVLASPLRRTTATAEAVARAVGLEVLPEPGFRELDFGRLEGLSFAEADAQFPKELAAFLASPDVPPPGGETLRSVAARVAAARDRVLDSHHRKTVLIATHVTPIKTLVCDALGAPLSAVNRMELSPASLTVIDYYEDGLASVRCVNDVGHL
ncbi:MAG TPA: bifunctional RNase H/acid phosphatase [Actinospica sp.]|nr:bifunctional RNase H/acid phosphatase [Actinospica sp.]